MKKAVKKKKAATSTAKKAAKKTASKTTRKKTAAKPKKKTTAQSRTAAKRKTVAAKKSTAKKSTAKKTAVKKTTAKKTAARKTTAKKTAAPPREAPSAPKVEKRQAPIIPMEEGAVPTPAAPAPPAPAAQPIGVVTHYYSHLSVAVVQLNEGPLRVGDPIHIKGHTTDLRQEVESMEVDHQSVQEASAGQMFGLKVRDHVREHDQIFRG